MPTSKHRINLTVPDELNKILNLLANRDNMPVASKTLELLKEAVELEEDKILSAIADARFESDKGKHLSHDEVWK